MHTVPKRLPLALALLATAATAQVPVHPDELKLKPQIDKAIAAGVENLLDQQRRDGSWSDSNYQGGRTGLVAYALLKSGVSMDHPALRRAFGYLVTIDPRETYSTACMMLAYAATGNEAYRPKLRRLLANLLEWQRSDGTFGYPHGTADLSNTQYAALGLWTANKAGLTVPLDAWKKLIKGTLKYQEQPHDVAVTVSKKTGVTAKRVAGFEYRYSKKAPPWKATGTMTTAGVSILKICEIGLGKRLRRAERRRLTESIEYGLNWLDVHFSVQHPQLPGKRGSWQHYYLYGMERVGALTRREEFGDHRWYLEGSRLLLKQQKKGAWGRAMHDTCFGLLFLRRATRVTGPVTGGGGGKSTHLFAAGGAADAIHFRGAGQSPVMLYIDGFGKSLLAEHGQYGLRILRVEYLEGKRKLGELAGNPNKAWAKDTFLHRCTALRHGEHTIVAKVIALAPDAPNGNTAKTVTISSKPMVVRIRDVFEPWMAQITEMHADNAFRDRKAKVTVTPSSNPKTAKNVFDGLDSTHWLAAPADRTPTLTFEFKKPVVCRRVFFTQALSTLADLKTKGQILAVEIAINSSKGIRVPMLGNPLAPTVFELKKPRRVTKLTVRVLERAGKPGLPLGFAEIVVGSKRVKKKR